MSACAPTADVSLQRGRLRNGPVADNRCPYYDDHLEKRTLRSCLEGQANILLRQRRLGVLGGLQIVELVQPHVLFERRFGGKAMQEHREPPGHTYGAPHATQRHLRIAIEVMGAPGMRWLTTGLSSPFVHRVVTTVVPLCVGPRTR